MIFLPCLEKKNNVLMPSTCLEGRQDLPLPCARRKYLLAVEISQVAFSGPEWRVRREDLAPVLVSITAELVAITGLGCRWRVCLVGYQCVFEVGTLGSERGFTLVSDGLCNLGREEGSLSLFEVMCCGGVGGVCTACRRIHETFKYVLSTGGPKYSEGREEIAFLLDRILMMSSAYWRR